MKDRFGNWIHEGSFVRLLDASEIHASNPEYCGGVYMVENLNTFGNGYILRLEGVPGLWTVGCVDSVVHNDTEEDVEYDVTGLFEV